MVALMSFLHRPTMFPWRLRYAGEFIRRVLADFLQAVGFCHPVEYRAYRDSYGFGVFGYGHFILSRISFKYFAMAT